MLYYILFNTELSAMDAVIHFIITLFVYMISITVHEFAHAYIAYKNGDPTPKTAGRLTLNPMKHLSIGGFLMFILLGVGWAKPVPTNPLNFKKYKKGMRLVSISGVCANFLLGLICAIISATLIATVGVNVGTGLSFVYVILDYFMIVNSFLIMFNILPIPPMDGYNFIETFTKPENRFIKFVQKNSLRLLIGILLIGTLTDLFFGFDIFTIYLSLIYDFAYLPITFIGVL